MIGMAAASLAGCAGKPAPAPQPAPVDVVPAPAAVAAAPEPEDWRDLPATPGAWTYSGDSRSSEARYAGFALRCDPAVRRVALVREGATGALTIRTSFGNRRVAAAAPWFPADDPALDEIAFSRGRFIVETEGQARLVVPAWPEASRVIEDCRG